MRSILLQVGFIMAVAGVARADAQVVDSATFIVRRGTDTVVVERMVREPVTVKGSLTIRGAAGHRESWSAVIADDGTMPLIEVSTYDTATSGDQKAAITRRSRIIFKDDSVAADDMTQNGMITRVFATKLGAVPYRNLSFALLEPVVQHTVGKGRAGGDVPFFNLGGGQTVVGSIKRTAADHATVTLGNVTMELTLDDQSRIVSAAIPSQNVTVERR